MLLRVRVLPKYYSPSESNFDDIYILFSLQFMLENNFRKTSKNVEKVRKFIDVFASLSHGNPCFSELFRTSSVFFGVLRKPTSKIRKERTTKVSLSLFRRTEPMSVTCLVGRRQIQTVAIDCIFSFMIGSHGFKHTGK